MLHALLTLLDTEKGSAPGNFVHLRYSFLNAWNVHQTHLNHWVGYATIAACIVPFVATILHTKRVYGCYIVACIIRRS